MTHRIRILIADDHPVVRDGLVAVLATQPDFEVIGQAESARDAVEHAMRLKPDVVLLDLEMPELDGVEALRQIAEAIPTCRCIVFTAFDTDEKILSAVRAGARGYLLKGAPRDEIFNAVRVVSAGGSLLQPVIATRIMSQANSELETLTARELEVLRYLARGLQNKEIGLELSITERTVKFHVSSILSKLDVGNRTEAVRAAVQRGLIDL